MLASRPKPIKATGIAAASLLLPVDAVGRTVFDDLVDFLPGVAGEIQDLDIAQAVEPEYARANLGTQLA
jgi:hypothetical protein